MTGASHSDVVVIGAGVAGLTCARELRNAGMKVVVLDKGKGVGGRCATRRVDGQPVDHGIAFLHGSSNGFLDEVKRVDAEQVPGWPLKIEGKGTPCQPESFAPGEYRLAFVDGMSVLPKHLARDLDVKLQTRVSSLAFAKDGAEITTEHGTHWHADTVILTTPPEQGSVLWKPSPDESPEVRTARHLLKQGATLPCLTVIAGYDLTTTAPDFCVMYPEESPVLKMLSLDSSKRRDPRSLVLVLQAHARFSRAHLEEPETAWTQEILDETARLLGAWAASPAWTQAHRWRHARLDRGTELARPMLVEAAPNVRLGLAGEMFAPGGGLEAAWSSGRRLAMRLLGKDA